MAPKKKGNDSQTTLRLPRELKEKCESMAEIDGISLNDWIVKAIRDYIELNDNPKLIKTVEILKTLSEEPYAKIVSGFAEAIRDDKLSIRTDEGQDYCHKCREFVESNDGFCPKCGCELPKR